MVTIVEPKEAVDKIWGKQRIRENTTYRLMKYVLRVDHDGKVLLHNVVTGRLVVLDEAEAKALEKLPKAYSPEMEQLVTEHYLVPEDYDEHQQVVNLRNILWTIEKVHSPNAIVYYTILPTTACNAQCWYCFQHSVKPATMSEETANDVVDFIDSHCNGENFTIRWFGGEPTLAANRIDQICDGLTSRSIRFVSTLTTNGYLLEDDLILKATKLWNLKQATISVDGTEESFNRIKSFVGSKDNPYQRVMHNIHKLLEYGVFVGLRMNYDRDNYQEFDALLQEVRTRFQGYTRLMVYPHQINMDYHYQINRTLSIEELKTNELWLNDKTVELFDMACQSGLFRRKQELPFLYHKMCSAANERATVITPEGNLVCCGEQLGSDQIKGNLKQGITNPALVRSWEHFADDKSCQDCVFFPDCAIVSHCYGVGRCYHKKEKQKQFSYAISAKYDAISVYFGIQ